jgi:hypothetical protein
VGSTDEDIAACTASLVLCAVTVDQLSAPPRWVEARICDFGLPTESQIALLENAAGGSSGEVQEDCGSSSGEPSGTAHTP